MPILSKDVDVYPSDPIGVRRASHWARATVVGPIHSLAPREKDLMRRLRALQIPFYSPLIAKRAKSPAGRVRTSYLPLFPCYVFLLVARAIVTRR